MRENLHNNWPNAMRLFAWILPFAVAAGLLLAPFPKVAGAVFGWGLILSVVVLAPLLIIAWLRGS